MAAWEHGLSGLPGLPLLYYNYSQMILDVIFASSNYFLSSVFSHVCHISKPQLQQSPGEVFLEFILWLVIGPSLTTEWDLNVFSNTHSSLFIWASIYCPKISISNKPLEMSHTLIVKLFETT